MTDKSKTNYWHQRYTKEKPGKLAAKLNEGFFESLGSGNEKNNDVNCEDLRRIEDKIDALNRKLDLIFGSHFVIDGQFMNLKINE